MNMFCPMKRARRAADILMLRGVCVCVYTDSTWRLKGCPPLSLSTYMCVQRLTVRSPSIAITLLFDTWSLPKPELGDSDKLADHQAPGLFLFLLPQSWDCRHALPCLVQTCTAALGQINHLSSHFAIILTFHCGGL